MPNKPNPRKWNEKEKAKIVGLRKKYGLSCGAIAERFGTTVGQIYEILSEENWGNGPRPTGGNEEK